MRRLWCRLFHRDLEYVTGPDWETFECRHCGTRWFPKH